MPLYDLTCQKGHSWSAYHGMREDHAPCPTCGGAAERDFSKGLPATDGTSQGGWPRKDMTVPRIWRNGKPYVREFTSRKDKYAYYNRTGKYARRVEFAEKNKRDPRGQVFVCE